MSRLPTWRRDRDGLTLGRFAAIPCPCPAQLTDLERLPPFSPFNTAAYADARERMGERAFVLGVWDEPRAVCLALETRGRMSRRIFIPSLPRMNSPAVFFEGLLEFCRSHRILDLDIDTFGSDFALIPTLGHEQNRSQRWEFVLDLSTSDPLAGRSTNHRRSANRASALGVSLRRSREERDVRIHLAAMTTSLERRKARGETAVAGGNAQEIIALVAAGAGEIFQAALGDKVLSSVLVLRSARVAYYHSAGTTPEGMNAGASAFLIGAAAMALKSAGIAEFNLGGAEPENAGLYRFKSGFGCYVRELERATFTLTDTAVLKLQAALRSAVQSSGGLTSKLFGSRISPSSAPGPADSSQ
jgi:hypothetical protein